jgi:signal peptidase I
MKVILTIVLTSIIFISCKSDQYFYFKNESNAMSNTLKKGITYQFIKQIRYTRNDIVAFKNYDLISQKEKVSIMRIIGILGDTIQYFKGWPYINGKKVKLDSGSKRFYFILFKSIDNNFQIDKSYIISRIGDTLLLNLTAKEKKKIEDNFNLREYYLSPDKKSDAIKFKAINSIDFFGPLIISKEMGISDDLYFLVGDNLQETIDSRYVGLIKREQILGKLHSRTSDQ